MCSRRLGLAGGLSLMLLVTSSGCGGVSVDSSRAVGGGSGGTVAGAQAGGAQGVTDGGGAADAAIPVGVPGAHSGSRLQVRGWSLDDVGAASGLIWDVERGIECMPAGSADGKERCLPRARDVTVWFTDPECTVPVIARPPSTDACAAASPPTAVPPYAVEVPRARCPGRELSVFQVGEAIAAPAAVYDASEIGCGPAASAGATFHEALPSPPGDWVPLDRELTGVTSRLGVAYWNGDDGSRLFGGLRLLPEDVGCTETDAEPGVRRCTPSDEAPVGGSYFEGKSCERPVALTFGCEPPQVLRGPSVQSSEPGADGCPAPSTPSPLFRPERIESSSVYTTNGEGACAPTPFPGFDYYRMGAVVPYEEYPVVESIRVGAGRFRTVHAESEGRKLFARPELMFDADVGAECWLTDLMSDGRMFCVSVGGGLSSFNLAFADARCEDPVVVVSACVDILPLAVFAPRPPGAPCSRVPLHEVGPRRAERVAFYRNGDLGGQCGRAEDGPVDLYDLGEPVDPAALFPLFTPTAL